MNRHPDFYSRPDFYYVRIFITVRDIPTYMKTLYGIVGMKEWLTFPFFGTILLLLTAGVVRLWGCVWFDARTEQTLTLLKIRVDQCGLGRQSPVRIHLQHMFYQINGWKK